MIAYILPYHSEQRRITAVLHGEKNEQVVGDYVAIKGVLLNISGGSDGLLMTRFSGWFIADEILYKKTDVVKQIFDPTPGKGSVRY